MSSPITSKAEQIVINEKQEQLIKQSSFSLYNYWRLARMDKFPAGSILIFWPTAWGYLLGARDSKPSAGMLVTTMAALIVWSALLHSVGCVINDICDVGFDRQVERTKNRPLASGAVSLRGAWIFFLLQISTLIYMSTLLNREAAICGIIHIFPLGTLYPLMKRITYWPQAWLGLAMNWSLPTAWLMSSPEAYNSKVMWMLLLGTLCWTIFYDTIYALQDRKDDLKAGVKSTAILFGPYVKLMCGIFGIMFLWTLFYAGSALGLGEPYFAISVGGTALHIIWQLVTLDVEDPKNCGHKFVSNGHLGCIVAAGMLVEWHLY